MDYTRAPLLFQVQKALRYLFMYGPSRTYTKVLGQYHMKNRFEDVPTGRGTPTGAQPFALIGCGNYAFANIAFYLHKQFGHAIGACMDVNASRAASLAARYRVPLSTTNVDDILSHDAVRLVFIASNHASHAEYAIQALERGKHVYIEKPHVVREEQLERLVVAMRSSQGKVFLGFNRPGSRFGRIISDRLAAQSGAGMYNWFVAGHEIDADHWYFKPEEGGRVLGNLCHWTDFTLRLVTENTFPIRIIPGRASKSDCDISVTYVFGEGSMGVITFSAKGHTFEGVKERFSAHRGNCLITMDDYRTMTVEIIEKKRHYVNAFRDHGHSRNILAAANSVLREEAYDRAAATAYVWNTGRLFLKTRQALEENREIVVDGFVG